MSALLVTYDLRKPGQDYDDFLKEIKRHSWARLSESSYAIDSGETPIDAFDRLSHYIDANDQLFVITLTNGWKGRGPQDVYDWLRQHL